MTRRAIDILGEALEADAADRHRVVDDACAGDDALRAEVHDLLRAHEAAGAFLDSPTFDVERAGAGDAAGEDRPGAVIGRYKLLQKIGEGGFGTVFMAEQSEPVRRRVALKVVKPGMDTRQVLARFEAERQALAMMDHPSIAKVLDGGATENGRPYFVMELVRGVPITEYADANRLSTRERVRLLADVCLAVQHAHQKGVIHRDLKPTNVLVTQHDGRPVPKVIDFGIAKAISTPLTDRTLFTEHRQMIGTPAYMSPEQAEMSAVDVDTRTDIYALGVLLYELLTGRTPFDATELREAGLAGIERIIREVEPPRPSVRLSTMGRELDVVARARDADAATLGRSMRGDLDWVVMTALAKERGRRYATAAEFARDLDRFLADEPVVAAPPSLPYRVRKLVRRHRVAVSVGAIVAATLVAATAISTGFALQSLRSREVAEAARADALAGRHEAERALALARARGEQNERLLHATAVRSASAAIDDGAIDLARRRLDAAPRPLRSWEWRWLDGVASDHGTEVGRHEPSEFGGLRDVEYSPDGRLAASGGHDATARVFDLQSGALLHVFEGHEEVVTGVSFDPAGERLATVSSDRRVMVWDLASGERIADLTGHTSWLAAVAFDPSGRWLASCGGTGNLRLWDARTLAPIRAFDGDDQDVWSLDFSPDGERLATCTGDGWIAVWNCGDGSLAWRRRAANNGLWSIRFDPAGERLAVAGFDNRASMWTADGSHLRDLPGANLPVRAAEFTPDGRVVVTAGFGTLRAFDASTGQELGRALSAQGDLHAIDFSADGGALLVGGDTPALTRWNLASLRAPVVLEGHDELVAEVEASPDGRHVFSAGFDGTVRAWDVLTGALAWESRRSPAVVGLAIAPDGDVLYAADRAGVLRALDAATGEERWRRAVGGRTTSIAVSPDGRTLAGGCALEALDAEADGATIGLWSLPEGTMVHRLLAHESPVNRMAFSPDGTLLASAGSEGLVALWTVADGALRDGVTIATDRVAHALAFDPDGARLAVGDDAGAVTTIALAALPGDGSTAPPPAGSIELAAHNSRIGSLAFTRDGARLLTAAWFNPEVRLWDLDAREPLLEIDTGITGLAEAAFLPADAGLVVAGMNGGLRAWELEPPTNVHVLRARSAATNRAHRARRAAIESSVDARSDAASDARRAGDPARALALLDEAIATTRAELGADDDTDDPLLARLARERDWTAPLARVAAAPEAPSRAALAPLVGGYGPARITLTGAGLVLAHEELPDDTALVPLGDDRFQARSIPWLRVRFDRDASGRGIRLHGRSFDDTLDLSIDRDDLGADDVRAP